MKLNFSQEDLIKLAASTKYENTKHFFIAIAQGVLNLDELLTTSKEKEKKEKVSAVLEYKNFVNVARNDAGGVLVDGESGGLLYTYAKCCNPVPGDPIIGYITIGEGIKIHRKTCNNLLQISEKDPTKLVSVQWPKGENSLFVAGITLMGEDSPGLLNELSHTIVSFKNTNIKSINVNTNDNTFEGSITVYVQDLDHLYNLIERLKKVKGVYSVERFED